MATNNQQTYTGIIPNRKARVVMIRIEDNRPPCTPVGEQVNAARWMWIESVIKTVQETSQTERA